MIEQSIEIGGKPPIPAYITLRRKYGPHRAGCKRREIMAKRAPLGQHVLGFLDPRKNQDEKLNLQAIVVDEAKMKKRMGDRRKYRGSDLEREHRGRQS